MIDPIEKITKPINKVNSFEDALKILNIEDFKDRIINSNSHGELNHIPDYILLAKYVIDSNHFRKCFIELVMMGEKYWKRPESIFQYIRKIVEGEIIKNG